MLGPMQVGDTEPPMHAQVTQAKKPFPLAGYQTSDIIVHMWNYNRQLHKQGAGTVTITDATQGLFDYHWDAADTDTDGLWSVWIQVGVARPATSITVAPLEIVTRESLQRNLR